MYACKQVGHVTWLTYQVHGLQLVMKGTYCICHIWGATPYVAINSVDRMQGTVHPCKFSSVRTW